MYSPPFIVFAVIIMMVYIGTIASVIWQTLQIRKQENSLFRIGLSLFGLLAMGVHSTMYLYMIVTVLDDEEQRKSAWPYYLLLPASIIASIAQCQISLGRYLVAIVNKATRDKIYHRMALVNGLVCLACVGISVFDVIRDSAKGKIPPYSIGFSLALVYCPIHGLIFGILFFSRAMRQIIDRKRALDNAKKSSNNNNNTGFNNVTTTSHNNSSANIHSSTANTNTNKSQSNAYEVINQYNNVIIGAMMLLYLVEMLATTRLMEGTPYQVPTISLTINLLMILNHGSEALIKKAVRNNNAKSLLKQNMKSSRETLQQQQ